MKGEGEAQMKNRFVESSTTKWLAICPESIWHVIRLVPSEISSELKVLVLHKVTCVVSHEGFHHCLEKTSFIGKVKHKEGRVVK